jgi:hypothetical protein
VLAAIACTTACGNPNQQNPQGDYGSVQGIVSSSAGPIAGAQVCIDVSLCATSGADGSYKIPNVPADPAGAMEPILVTATGYQTFSGQVHVTAGTTPTPFNVTLTHA